LYSALSTNSDSLLVEKKIPSLKLVSLLPYSALNTHRASLLVGGGKKKERKKKKNSLNPVATPTSILGT